MRWITIPIEGGYVDITFIVIGVVLLIGSIFAHRYTERKERDEYEKERRMRK